MASRHTSPAALPAYRINNPLLDFDKDLSSAYYEQIERGYKR